MLYKLDLLCVMWHNAALSAIHTPLVELSYYTMNAMCRYAPGIVTFSRELPLLRYSFAGAK